MNPAMQPLQCMAHGENKAKRVCEILDADNCEFEYGLQYLW